MDEESVGNVRVSCRIVLSLGSIKRVGGEEKGEEDCFISSCTVIETWLRGSFPSLSRDLHALCPDEGTNCK